MPFFILTKATLTVALSFVKKKHQMRNYFLIPFLLFFFSLISFGQQTICLGDNATICAGDQITIQICNAGGGPNADTNVVFLGNVNQVNLTDDVHSGLIPIGFPFTFYGNTYNNTVISSNGYLTFNAGAANTYSPWSINQAAPSAGIPTNSIMGPWQDYNPNAFGSNGIVGWTLIGNAPNRRFVAVWKNVFMFGTQEEGCSVIVLHETSNKIEVFLDEKPVVAWNGGAAIEATHNQPGNIAHVVTNPPPARNWPNQWTANLDGQEWIPNGANSYINNPIPYKAYVINNGAITWGDTNGNTYLSNGTSITVTPNPIAPSDSVGYFVNYSSCATTGMVTSDTSWIKVNTVTAQAIGVNDFCSAGIGEATVIGFGGSQPYSYLWSNGMTTQTITGLTSGTYSVTVFDAIGCSATTSVVIGDSPIQLSTTSSLVSCPGGSDGTATVTISPVPASATYLWSDGQTTQTATGLSAGTYTVEVLTSDGCDATASVTVTEIPGMVITITQQNNVTCNSGNDGLVSINVTQGTAPYSYSWTNSNSTTNTASDLPAGTHTVTVTDANGCVQSVTFTLTEPSALQVNTITPNQIICKGDSVQVTATGIGGSSDYIYTWSMNGVSIGTGQFIYVKPNTDNSIVCVTLTEVCGSPAAQACLTVSYPDDIIPEVSPSTVGECIPVEVIFTNTTNSSEVDYTIWTYGNGDVDTVAGLGFGFATYPNVGLYDVSMEIVSNFGCRYTRTFNDLIAGYGYPTAGFFVNPSPASIFNPNVIAYDNSSFDAVEFEWFAENAVPNYSTLKNVPLTYPNEVGQYPVTLVVTNAYGCKDTITRLVDIRNEVLLFAPNTFTPDGDQYNERWRVFISGIDIFDFHLTIYNRWGEVVFESFDPEGEWDGTYGGRMVPSGTYIWTIEVGETITDERYQFNGHVSIVR
jgi:gliding motility-associated-like protein